MLFVSDSQATFFLRRFSQIWEFRKLLNHETSVNTSAWNLEQVFKGLSGHLRTRRLRIEKRWQPGPSTKTYVEAVLVVPRKEVVDRAPEQEPSTFPAQHDPAAQSETLAGAAEDGAPFCEECEKARLEQLANSPPSPPPQPPAKPDPPSFPENHDAAAQAKTLSEAADEGVPFCEECEKARQAAAA